MQNEQEYKIIFKSSKEKCSALKNKIEELHSYDTPCILNFEVEANTKYLSWLKEEMSLPS